MQIRITGTVLQKQTKVELKAYASKEGMEDSDVVTFTYTIDRMSKLEHKSRLMYDMDSMKVWSVIDYDSDKMYLIKGSKRCTADRRRHGIGRRK